MFIAIAAGIGIATSIAGMYETTLAERAAMEQINLQAKQRELQLTQKKKSIYDNTLKVLHRQTAQATTRGVGMGSGSFNAIQRDTLNTGVNNIENADTELSFNEYNASAEKENARNTMYAKLFGEASSAATSFAMLENGSLGKFI